MKKVFLGILFILISQNLSATVYKCVKGNKISFSQKPCDGVTVNKNQYKVQEINVIENKVLGQQKSVDRVKNETKMTMRPQTAIKIKDSSCKQSMAGKVTYAGIIHNISNYSTYGARLTIQYKFKLHEKDKAFLSWDSSERGFKLAPNKSIGFSISSNRLLPNDSSVKCESTLVVKFLSSTNGS